MRSVRTYVQRLASLPGRNCRASCVSNGLSLDRDGHQATLEKVGHPERPPLKGIAVPDTRCALVARQTSSVQGSVEEEKLHGSLTCRHGMKRSLVEHWGKHRYSQSIFSTVLLSIHESLSPAMLIRSSFQTLLWAANIAFWITFPWAIALADSPTVSESDPILPVDSPPSPSFIEMRVVESCPGAHSQQTSTEDGQFQAFVSTASSHDVVERRLCMVDTEQDETIQLISPTRSHLVISNLAWSENRYLSFDVQHPGTPPWTVSAEVTRYVIDGRDRRLHHTVPLPEMP